MSREMPSWRKWTLRKEGRQISIKTSIIEIIFLNYRLLPPGFLNLVSASSPSITSSGQLTAELCFVWLFKKQHGKLSDICVICVGSEVNFNTGRPLKPSVTPSFTMVAAPLVSLIAQAAWTLKPFKGEILQGFPTADISGEVHCSLRYFV